MIRLLVPALLLTLVACESGVEETGLPEGETGETSDTGETGETGETAEDIAIAGPWVDYWGTDHTVSNTDWTQGAMAFAITTYDNDATYAIAQNDADNAWSPGLWSRFDWGWAKEELVYCQTAYDKATEADALATPAADIGDPRSGCGGFPWTVMRAPTGIDGVWDDAWGGSHAVGPFAWVVGSDSFIISKADPAAQWAVAQNSASNSWNPELWSRFDWHWQAGDLYYCQTAYDKATEADASSTPPADGTDLAGGCGGFPWTALRASLPITGAWSDDWGTSHVINAFEWAMDDSTFEISQATPAENWLVAQNGASNAWSPGLWSRFDWAWDSDGGLYYCQIAYDKASEADAAATPAADGANLGSGCGGFGWTALSAAP